MPSFLPSFMDCNLEQLIKYIYIIISSFNLFVVVVICYILNFYCCWGFLLGFLGGGWCFFNDVIGTMVIWTSHYCH